MKMRTILSGKIIMNRITSSRRRLCSSAPRNNPTAKCGGASDGEASPSSNHYDEQYKALNNLDFMTAAKILFTDPPKKKKFGLDFHLVQLFFVCLPSLAVYLVAQYARSEMRKMDAELELKKQAEFEAKAKEMELKAAEEKAAAASDPRLLEVKERLAKLEEEVREIVAGSKRPSSDPVKQGKGDLSGQSRTVETKTGHIQPGSQGKLSEESALPSGEKKTNGISPVTQASQENKKAA
ncbi:hypothetical protein F511_17299 [Dorcoceras hygrometricum]|uniref:Uncharacterized protein n=1 Tax=Dorcoceras hygrometricum TaxID=472368 RepID=A0A2Z7BDP9_9LAMI|nr:hypothetical protein F511_17299 [Dorcoceras hygrometricum]